MPNEARVREIAEMIWDTFSGRRGGPYAQQPENGIARKQCDDLARAIAALPVQVPAGWKMVPQRPIYEQGEAGIAALGKDDNRDPATIAFDVYTAMLAASPPAPAPASQVLTEEDYHEIGERCILDDVLTDRLHDETRVTMKTAIAKAVGHAIIDRLTHKDAEPHHSQGRNKRT